MNRNISSFITSVKVGYFLAVRDIKRGSRWTSILIIFVMMLTFLNLIVIRGILVGLTEGSVQSYRVRYTGDVLLSTLDKKQYISDSQQTLKLARNLPFVESASARYIAGGTIEADYKTQVRRDQGPDLANAVFVGIDPNSEEATTGLSKLLVKGKYLDKNALNQVLVGVSLLQHYQSAIGTGTTALKTADVGSTIRITVNNKIKEVLIVGVLKGKVTNIDGRVFMLDQELQAMMGRSDYNVNEIAIKTKAPGQDAIVKSELNGNQINSTAIVQTWQEAEPQFVRDISATFALLGNVIGGTGLVVAAITIFIVIFVNAITRRKYIGILKGVGISALAIECSYVFQSLYYAVSGTCIGLAIVYGLLVPYFNQHVINFPFSDGIFVADVGSVFFRVIALYIATVFAGFFPARIVVKQNTLDAILGR